MIATESILRTAQLPVLLELDCLECGALGYLPCYQKYRSPGLRNLKREGNQQILTSANAFSRSWIEVACPKGSCQILTIVAVSYFLSWLQPMLASQN